MVEAARVRMVQGLAPKCARCGLQMTQYECYHEACCFCEKPFHHTVFQCANCNVSFERGHKGRLQEV